MAWKLAELFVEIGAKTSPLSGALTGVKGQLLGLSATAGRVGSSIAGALGGLAAPILGLAATVGIAGIAIAAAFGIAVAAGLMSAAKAASDLNETISKTEQVFGTSTDSIIAGADEMAHKFGVVRGAFLDAASTFGAIIQGEGIATEKSAEMSNALAKLAVDASSFFNVPVDVALRKIEAGLVGQSRPLRAFGVTLTEEAVKAKAVAMGLGNVGKEISETAKVMARAALIQERLGKVVGDTERTGHMFAGQARQMTGHLKNMAASIGELVVPAFTKMLQVINFVLGGVARRLENFVKKWQEMLYWLGLGGETPEARAARREEITKRNDAMAAEAKAEQDAAMKHNKGFQGGLEEWARRIQAAAFGPNQNTVPQKQLAVAQQQLKAQQQNNALLQQMAGKPQAKPVVAVAG